MAASDKDDEVYVTERYLEGGVESERLKGVWVARIEIPAEESFVERLKWVGHGVEDNGISNADDNVP